MEQPPGGAGCGSSVAIAGETKKRKMEDKTEPSSGAAAGSAALVFLEPAPPLERLLVLSCADDGDNLAARLLNVAELTRLAVLPPELTVGAVVGTADVVADAAAAHTLRQLSTVLEYVSRLGVRSRDGSASPPAKRSRGGVAPCSSVIVDDLDAMCGGSTFRKLLGRAHDFGLLVDALPRSGVDVAPVVPAGTRVLLALGGDADTDGVDTELIVRSCVAPPPPQQQQQQSSESKDGEMEHWIVLGNEYGHVFDSDVKAFQVDLPAGVMAEWESGGDDPYTAARVYRYLVKHGRLLGHMDTISCDCRVSTVEIRY